MDGLCLLGRRFHPGPRVAGVAPVICRVILRSCVEVFGVGGRGIVIEAVAALARHKSSMWRRSCGLLDGQVGGLGTLEYLVHVASGAPVQISKVRPIRQEASGSYCLYPWVHCW